jgi:hypothetical protein
LDGREREKDMKIFAAVVFIALMAGDVSGKWTLHYDQDFSGHPATHQCTLRQQGEKLTATCDDGAVTLTGHLQDRKVTFEHTTGKNNEIVVRYTGMLNQEGSFMKGGWQYVDPHDKKEKTGRFAFEKQ